MNTVSFSLIVFSHYIDDLIIYPILVPVLKFKFLDDYDGKLPFLDTDYIPPYPKDRYSNYDITIRNAEKRKFFRLNQADIVVIVGQLIFVHVNVIQVSRHKSFLYIYSLFLRVHYYYSRRYRRTRV